MAKKLETLLAELDEVRAQIDDSSGVAVASDEVHLKHQDLMQKIQEAVRVQRSDRNPSPDTPAPDGVATDPPTVNG